MQTKTGPRTQIELAKRAGIAQATIGRALRAESGATVDTLDAIADVYGLEAWQLLVAGMEPSNPPVLMPISSAERALYARLKETAVEIANLPPARYEVKPK